MLKEFDIQVKEDLYPSAKKMGNDTFIGWIYKKLKKECSFNDKGIDFQVKIITVENDEWIYVNVFPNRKNSDVMIEDHKFSNRFEDVLESCLNHKPLEKDSIS